MKRVSLYDFPVELDNWKFDSEQTLFDFKRVSTGGIIINDESNEATSLKPGKLRRDNFPAQTHPCIGFIP